MIAKLKSEEYKDYSKADVIKTIKEYLSECKTTCLKSNLSDEDFDSPSWALRQASNSGMIKMINKMENFLPNE